MESRPKFFLGVCVLVRIDARLLLWNCLSGVFIFSRSFGSKKE